MRKVVIAGVILLATLNSALGQVVAVNVRKSSLDRAAAVFAPTEVSIDSRLKDVPDPFFRTPAAPGSRTPDVDQSAPAQSRLSDQDALSIIARNFKPTGIMALGDRKAIVLPDGRNLPAGSNFSATINGETYTIEITEINPGGYTLRLGNSTLGKTFGASLHGISAQ